MKSLRELINQNSRHLKLVDALVSQHESSPLRKLFEILKSKDHLDDNQAMVKIYGRKNLTAFSRLKFRMKELLLQGIIFQLNNNNPTDLRTNEALLASRNTLLGKSLATKELHWISTELLEKTITKGIKYHLTDDVLLQARMLIIYYSISETYNKYKIKKYLDIQSKYLKIYEWEIKSENYFLELQKIQIHSLANVSENAINRVKEYCKELDSVNEVDSFRFIYNKYRISSALFEYQKDYSSMLKSSDEFLKYIEKQPSVSPSIAAAVNVRKLWAYLQAGREDQAITFGLASMTKQKEGSVAWFRIGYYVLKGHLYLKQYETAIKFLNYLMGNPNFKKLNEYYTELFKTPLAYLHLIVESGTFKLSKDTVDKLPDFKLGKFLNETPVYSKDKRGINISILLMHIAFLLLRKDYNSIIDRTDSLNQYAYRYLRRDDSFRSNCMIKMVIQMTRADFHPVRTERYTADLRKQLSSVSLAGSGENIEIEVIPFEVLWDIMVKSL